MLELKQQQVSFSQQQMDISRQDLSINETQQLAQAATWQQQILIQSVEDLVGAFLQQSEERFAAMKDQNDQRSRMLDVLERRENRESKK